MSVNVGVNIRGHNRDLLESIAGSKAALASLRGESNRFGATTRQQSFEQRNLSRALNEQKRSLGALTGQYVGMRKALLTLGLRTAIVGFASMTAAISSAATTVVGLTAALSELGAGGLVLAGSGMMALGQGLIVAAAGFKNVWKALTGVGTAKQNALDKLTKEGRSFVAYLGTLKITFQDFQKLAQKGMFPGIERGLKSASRGFRDLKQVVYDTGRVIGYIGERFGKLFGDRHADFKKILERNVVTLRKFGDTAVNLTGALLGVFKAADPFIAHVTSGIVKFSKTLDNAANSANGQKGLGTFFRVLSHEWDVWTSIIGKTGQLLFNVFKAAIPAQDLMEKGIGRTLDKWVAWTGSTKGQNFLGDFFTQSIRVMGSFADLLGGVVKVWTDLTVEGNSNAIRFFEGIKSNVLPIISTLGKTLNAGLFPSLMDLFGSIADLVRSSLLPGLQAAEPLFRLIADSLKFFVDTGTSFSNMMPGFLKLLALPGVLFAWGKLKTAISLAMLELRRYVGLAAEANYLRPGIRTLVTGGGRNNAAESPGGFSSVAGPVVGYGGGRGISRAEMARMIYMSQPGFNLGSPPGAKRYAVPGANNIIGRYRDVVENRGIVGPVTTGNRYLARSDQLGPHGPQRLYGAAADPGTYIGAVPTRYRVADPYPGYGYRQRGVPRGQFRDRFRTPAPLRGIPTEFAHRRSPSTLRERGALAAYEDYLYGPDLNKGPSRTERGLGRVSRGVGAVSSRVGGIGRGFGKVAGNPLVQLAAFFGLPFIGNAIKTGGNTSTGFHLPQYNLADKLGSKVGIPKSFGFSANENLIKSFGSSADATFKKLQKLGDTRGLVELSRQAHDLEKTNGLEKYRQDLLSLEGAVDKVVMKSVIPNFAQMAAVGGKHLTTIRQRVFDTSFAIEQKLGQGSAQGKIALSHNFALAVNAVKKSMKEGVISTATGMKEIHRLMRENLAQYGITGKQAARYLSGKDTLTGKSDSTDTGGNVGQAKGASHGLYQIGRPGEGGRDNVPTMLNGQPVVVARGENIAVFNRHQRKFLDDKLASEGGLKGVFSKVKTPNYMAAGGFVNKTGAHVDTPGEKAIAGGLDKMGQNMGVTFYPSGPRSARRTAAENLAVGGAQNSNHLRGLAMDVAPEIIKSIANGVLHGFNLNRPMPGNWRDDSGRIHDERNHIELFNGIRDLLAGGAGGSKSNLDPMQRAVLKRVRAKGVGGTLGAIVQGALDMTRGGAQHLLDSINPTANLHAFGGGSGKAKAFAHMQLKRFGWGEGEWPSLDQLWTRESGWNPNAVNPSSGAAGIPQALGHGNVFKLGDYAAQVMWGMRYIKDRYGSPVKAWAHEQASGWYNKGGILPAIFASGGVNVPGRDDGYPDTPAEQLPGDKKAADKKKKAGKKKKGAKTIYPSGAPQKTPYGESLLGKTKKATAKKLKSLKKIRVPRKVKKLAGKLPYDITGPLVDPLTGETIDVSKYKLVAPIQGMMDGYAKAQGTLGNMQDEHNVTDEASIVNGVINWDGLISTDDGKFYGGIHQHVGELNEELGLLMGQGSLDSPEGGSIYGTINGAIQAIKDRIGLGVDKPSVLGTSPEDAIAARRARLKKIKKSWTHAVGIRRATAKKIKKMDGKYDYKDAISDNNDLISKWRAYKRDGSHLPESFREGIDTTIQRITDTNRHLREKKPAGGDKLLRASYEHDYKQAGATMKYLTGDPDAMAWTPDGGLAGRMVTSINQWRDVKDWRDSSMGTLNTDGHTAHVAIEQLIKEIHEWNGTVAPAGSGSTVSDLKDQINQQLMTQHNIDQAQFATMAGFAPLVGQRLIGAFAHGGVVPETGMALVHKGERIWPSPDGPYRNGMNAPASVSMNPSVEVNMHGDMAPWMKQLEVMIDGRIERQFQARGRKSRLIAISGG